LVVTSEALILTAEDELGYMVLLAYTHPEFSVDPPEATIEIQPKVDKSTQIAYRVKFVPNEYVAPDAYDVPEPFEFVFQPINLNPSRTKVDGPEIEVDVEKVPPLGTAPPLLPLPT
jgi:hypothetical protein